MSKHTWNDEPSHQANAAVFYGVKASTELQCQRIFQQLVHCVCFFF